MKKTLLFLIALLSLSTLCAQPATVYFDAGDPIRFGKTDFRFGWSSHPTEAYYLQEYFPKGEVPEHYNEMFTVSLIFHDRLSAKMAVEAKIAELEERKKTDACCNYQLYENDGEYMLDFLVSAGEGGELSVVEFDLHHYRVAEIEGRKALQLNFYSRRAYGDDIGPFLKGLKKQRPKYLETMIGLRLPEIKIVQNE